MVYSGNFAFGLLTYSLAAEDIKFKGNLIKDFEKVDRESLLSPDVIEAVYLGHGERFKDPKGGAGVILGGIDEALPLQLFGSLRHSFRPQSPYWSAIDLSAAGMVSFYRYV